MIYNFAPSYREAIFKLIDQEYDCDWYFGNNETDIKGLDLSVLQRTQLLKNHVIFRYCGRKSIRLISCWVIYFVYQRG